MEIACDANLTVAVSSEQVTATSAGVPVRVTGELPAGAGITYRWERGGGDIWESPEPSMLDVPPGDLLVSCWRGVDEGEPVTVTIVDPGHHWSSLTLADLGCPMGAIPSWTVSEGTGTTPEGAVADLVANLTTGDGEPAYTRFERADIGYPDSPTQTWIVGSADTTSLTAVVYLDGSAYRAGPDHSCQPSAWATAPAAPQ